MRTRVDITGQRFGLLTAIRPVQNEENRTAWLCKCECGNELKVITRYLRSGKKTHCGCNKCSNVERLHYVDGTCIEMIQSTTVRSNNRSGHTGVFYDNTNEKWRAELTFKGKRYNLGRFDTIEEAVKARERAQEMYFYSLLREFSMKHAAEQQGNTEESAMQ